MLNSMNRFRRLVVLVALSALPNVAGWAQSRVECGALNSKILKAPVRYCAFLPPHYDESTPVKRSSARDARRYPVLYYLHGLGDNEQSLVNTGGWNLIQDLREQHKIGDFIIVAPEGDRTFYVNSRDGQTPYSEFFIGEFMPAIEHRYRVLKSSRGIMGISMGGYGALRFAFAYPRFFTSVSAQSAALMLESPKDLNMAMKSGFGQTSLLGDVFGNPIDLAFWRQNSPFVLAQTNRALIAKLKIYFDCGSDDEYGFDQGASALHQELVAKKIRHEFHLYPGGHNLVFFLQHLGESVEFHSRTFDESR